MGADLGLCDIAAIGSGGPYALAAARALIALPDYDAKTIGELKALKYHLLSPFHADLSLYTSPPIHPHAWHIWPTVGICRP